MSTSKKLSLAPAELAPYIQHTRIEPGTTQTDMLLHARQAVEHGFNAAMIPASWIALVAAELSGTGVEIATALDFPIVGIMSSKGKAAEAEQVACLGATQIDMGVQIGWLKSGLYDEFRSDIAGVVRASGLPVKVMLELPLLNSAERDAAIDLAQEAGALYLKNASSGHIEVASSESIRYLAERARPGVKIKASGSITTYEHAISLLSAGADLIGTSAGLQIIGRTGDNHTSDY